MAVSLGLTALGAVATSFGGCGGAIEEDVADAAHEAERVTACTDSCKREYSDSVVTYEAIDRCLAESCKGPCFGGTTIFDAGREADTVHFSDSGGAHVCGTRAITGVVACDHCAATYCCLEWVRCYDDTRCVAYENCLNRCR